MNERSLQILNLFFTGYSQQEIATYLGIHKSSVNNELGQHGVEWVENYVKSEYKQRITDLVEKGKNSAEIASILGMPWNRHLVLFVVRKLQILSKISAVSSKSTEDFSPLNTYRCMMCSRPFQMTNYQAQSNPDRICSNHEDRRNDERRNISRAESTTQDGSRRAAV